MNYLPNGWYYNSLSSRSPAWTGVDEFWNFGVSNKSVGLKLVECDINGLEIADIVQLGNDNDYYHTLIVTKIEQGVDKRIFVSAHDYAAYNVPLQSYSFNQIRFAKTYN